MNTSRLISIAFVCVGTSARICAYVCRKGSQQDWTPAALSRSSVPQPSPPFPLLLSALTRNTQLLYATCPSFRTPPWGRHCHWTLHRQSLSIRHCICRATIEPPRFLSVSLPAALSLTISISLTLSLFHFCFSSSADSPLCSYYLPEEQTAVLLAEDLFVFVLIFICVAEFKALR